MTMASATATKAYMGIRMLYTASWTGGARDDDKPHPARADVSNHLMIGSVTSHAAGGTGLR